MPSTSTTSVALGSILDLLGPGAQSTSPDKDQPPFDALLKSLPPPLSDRSAPRRDDSAPEARDAAPPTSTTDSTDSAQNQTRLESSEGESSPPDVANEQANPSPPEPESSATADVLLVESLAGLVAATQPIAALETSVAAEEDSETGEQAPCDPTIACAKTSPARTTISATSPQSELTRHSPDDASSSANLAPAESSVDQGSDAGQSGALAATTGETADFESATSLDALEGLSSSTSHETATDSHDQRIDNPTHNESSAIELAAAGENASPSTQSATESTNQSPTAAPPASQPAPTDSPPAATSSSSPSAIAFSSPQSRLPADVLAQPTGASNRRSTTTIDTTRLLTRVARAFAAAQERDGEIRLRLSPPELGSLRLEVRIQDGALVARLQTETEAARTAIIENLPALRERLSDQGVRIERFDVDLMQRQPGGTPDQPGGQQPEGPATPLRVTPVSRSRSGAPAGTRSSPTISPTGGLNVIV